MIVLNQHQINLAVQQINGNPEEAIRRRDAATSPSERALWSWVLKKCCATTPQKRRPHG